MDQHAHGVSVIADIWRDIRQAEQARALEAIRKDPAAYKLTMIMADGRNANWRYWPAGRDGRGREIRFAWSVHRNAAGWFLGWREIVAKDGTIQRDRFFARKIKKRCAEIQRERAAKERAARTGGQG